MPLSPFYAIAAILALLPSVFWFAIYMWEDREEPEPRSLLIRLFIAGIASAFLAVVLEEPIRLLAGRGFLVSREIQLIFIAVIEKAVILIAVLLVAWRSKAFTQIIDGVIYAVVVTLGFTFIENLFFFAIWVPRNIDLASAHFGGSFSQVVIFRFFLTTFLQTFTAGIFGLALGKAAMARGKHIGWIVFGFLVAVFIHAAFDIAVLRGYIVLTSIVTTLGGIGFLILIRSKKYLLRRFAD